MEGFQAGADDFVVKPFDPDEVLARIVALVNRFARAHNTATGTGPWLQSSQT